MVATDAIGMGLNLNIDRIIFYRLRKVKLLDGKRSEKNLTQSEIKQIAGRAGRYTKDGLVSSFKIKDLNRLHKFIDDGNRLN